MGSLLDIDNHELLFRVAVEDASRIIEELDVNVDRWRNVKLNLPSELMS